MDGRGQITRPEQGVGLGKPLNEEPCLQWPSRGFYSFNLFNSTEFTIPKCREEINERTLLTGIGYEREIRKEKTIDLSPW